MICFTEGSFCIEEWCLRGGEKGCSGAGVLEWLRPSYSPLISPCEPPPGEYRGEKFLSFRKFSGTLAFIIVAEPPLCRGGICSELFLMEGGGLPYGLDGFRGGSFDCDEVY